jgi:hypothetical protein
LYIKSGNGERCLLHKLGEGDGIELDVGVLNLSARSAHKVSVTVDVLVIAQGLPLTDPELGYLPRVDEQGERPIHRCRSDTLDPFADAVKDLPSRRVVLCFGDHVQYRPALRSQPERGCAHASARISSHHWQYQSCPTRTRSFGCQQ